MIYNIILVRICVHFINIDSVFLTFLSQRTPAIYTSTITPKCQINSEYLLIIKPDDTDTIIP